MIALSPNNPTVAALCFPEITKRIQAELDNVVGRDRLPAFDDESLLPFLGAFIKEVTRRVHLHSSITLPADMVDGGST